MKTNFLLMSVVMTSLFSCSSDSDSNSDKDVKIVTSSNTSGKITYTNLSEQMPMVINLTIGSMDTDGIFYDSMSDEIVLASRSNNVLEVYGGIETALMNGSSSLTKNYSSTSDFNNPREVTVSGDKYVVTQDQNAGNLNTNKLVVYQKSATGFTLLNSYTVDFKIWGIFLQGTTMYAVADLTGDLVVFENFFTNPSGTITATKRVTIEGLVRTHGIFYSAIDNTMILTDVGSATSDSDGGIIVINNFSNVLSATTNLGTITMSSQKRIYGANSKLGNPVDVSYNYMTDKIYVAERLNEGGKLLTFNKPTSTGDASPIESRMEPGISSVYLIRK